MRCPLPVTSAVLIEPELPEIFAPLSSDGTWCGLPLVGHALLDRHLEQLVQTGVRTVELWHQGPAGRGAEFAALATRWGIHLAARPLPAGSPTPVSGNLPTLLLRLDCWPGADGLQALLFGSCMPNRRLAGPSGPMPCYVSMGGAECSGSLVYCREARLVRSLEDYWHASMAVLGRLALTNHLERAMEGERYIGVSTRLHDSVQLAGPCLVGSGAYVGRDCVIGPHAIVGEGAYLDGNVRLTDSLVLGDCHVASGIELHGVIVTATSVLCWRSGRTVEFDHTVVLPNRWSWPPDNAALTRRPRA